VRGLAALHNAGIIFRELAPARVLIADHDRRAVLTEFELAKLLDGSPSVSSEWPEDPYRAPEIDGGTATIQSDLYSLAHVAVAAISGSDADALHSEESLGSVKLPKRLQRLLLQSLEPIPAKRPIDLAPVMKELSCWSEK
jgi:serine/threonine protein kinase